MKGLVNYIFYVIKELHFDNKLDFSRWCVSKVPQYNQFLTHQFKHVFLGAQKNRLIETDVLSTHNICFG